MMNEKTAVTFCLNHPVYRLRSISVLRVQSELKCNKNASSTCYSDSKNAILWAQAAKIVGCTATQAENRIKYLKKTI